MEDKAKTKKQLIDELGTLRRNIAELERRNIERAVAEESPREQERFTQELIENSAVATFVLNRHHKVVLWNRACEELTGIKAFHMKGTDQQWKPFYTQKRLLLADIIIDGSFEDMPSLYVKYARSTLSENGLQSEGWYQNLNGRDRYIIFDASPILNTKGEMVAVIETLQDISERKRAEELLQEREEELRIIFEASPAGILLLDREGKTIYANQSMAGMFGYALPELIGMSYSNHLHVSERTSAEINMRRHIAGEIGSFSTERHYIRKDGSDFWGYLCARRLEGSDGKLRALVAIIADISERKKMEEKIFQVSHDWEETFNTITDMITVHDTDFNIIRSNKAAEKILGLTCLEGSKSKCYENYHGMGFPASGCPGCQCLLTGEPNTSEMFEPHLNRFIEISAIPRRDNRNKLIGLIHIVRDITGRKRVEQQIAEQMQRLAALRNIDTAITSSLDMRISIKIILTEVANQLHVDACDILFLNPHTQDLEYIAGRGFNTEALRHTRLRLGESHAGVAALEKRTVRVRDLSVGRDGFVRSPLLGKEGFVEYIAVPLISKGHVKGVLEIFHRTAINADQEWLDFMEALGVQSAIAIDNAQMFNELEHSNTELALAYDTTLEGWSRALDYRDKETEGHSRRVTEMTVKMAQSIGIIDEDLVQVRRGALLHDIGKLGVPDGILLKPGKLTDEEMEIIKKHPIIAYEILSPISFLRKAIDIPYCHHEKWDGTGYPRGLKGEQIPLAARIFAVVDVFDALMSDRPYREAWTKDKTLEYIREQAGIHFDPTVVENFIDTDWLMVK